MYEPKLHPPIPPTRFVRRVLVHAAAALALLLLSLMLGMAGYEYFERFRHEQLLRERLHHAIEHAREHAVRRRVAAHDHASTSTKARAKRTPRA